MRVAFRCFAVAVMGAGWAFLATAPLLADTRVKSLGKVQQGICPIAIDSSNRPHVAFQSKDYHLHHAWLDGRRWRKELVDGASDCGWGSSISVSAGGEIHISYFAERRDPVRGRLVHALFSGGAWRTTDLETSGRNTRLALDSGGRPHILYENDAGMLGYARFDGAAWSLEDTGLGTSPYTTGLALDGEGHAHISHAINYQGYFHGTNATGAWVSTQLGSASAPTGIALDSQGRPVVAAAQDGVLRLHRGAGEEWTVEDLSEFGPPLGVRIDGLALALDGSDRAHLLVGAFISVAESSAEIALHASETEHGWRMALIDLKHAGHHPSLALNASGVVHGTYGMVSREDFALLKYVRIAVPDLSAAWQGASVTEVRGVTRITGLLTIRNQGPGVSSKTAVVLVLSDDDVVDDGDTVLPGGLRVRKLKPGQTATLKVRVRPAGSVAGKRLFAFVVPDIKAGDLDLTNNTASVLLP